MSDGLPTAGTARGTQRYKGSKGTDEDGLTRAITSWPVRTAVMATGESRSSCRKRWCSGNDRVQRIWRAEGLKVPQKQRPWRMTTAKSFNGESWNEFLNGGIFYSLREAQIVIEKCRVEYNTATAFGARLSRPPAQAAHNTQARF